MLNFINFIFLNNITGGAGALKKKIRALNKRIKALNKGAEELYKNIKIFNNRARAKKEAVNILIWI